MAQWLTYEPINQEVKVWLPVGHMPDFQARSPVWSMQKDVH